MSSKAQTGLGTTLAINTGTVSTPVWTTIAEIFDLTQNGYENETDDVTNLQSTAREFVGTILNPGMWDFTMNRVSTDTGQAAVQAALASAATKMFKLTLPINAAAGQSTQGDTYAFNGIIQKFPLAVKADKAIKVTGSIKVSNAITFTEGS